MSIDGLARDLGVSHTPVREALAQLEHTGLVTREALKGYRVAPPPLGPQGMAELLSARCVIEVAAVPGLVPASDNVREQLEMAHDQHELAARRVRGMAERGLATGRPGNLTLCVSICRRTPMATIVVVVERDGV